MRIGAMKKQSQNKPNFVNLRKKIHELPAGRFSQEAKERLEIIFYPAPVQNNMHNHQNDKQKCQIKVDTAPLVPGHRPKLFYGFSAAAVVKLAAKPTTAGRQYVLHNKAGKSQTQQIKKRNQINNEIQ